MRYIVIKVKNVTTKIDLNKEFLSLNFNWISIMVVATFYVYGFFGYGATKFKQENISFHVILLLYIFSLLFLISTKKYFNIFNDKISLKYKDLTFFFYFVSFIFISARRYLSEYQSGDELSYIGTAFQIPIKVLNLLDFVPITFKINNLIHAVSLMLLVCNLLFIKKILKSSLINQIIIICIVTALLHAILSSSGANLFGYSKLNALPYFVFGSIFGINPLVFRITTICIVGMTLTLICKFLSNTFNIPTAYWLIVISFFIYTPIELLHSIIIEQSIFYFIFGIIPLIEIFFRKNSTPERYIPLLIIGVYFRSTVLLILFLYVVHIIFLYKGKREIIYRLSPITLLLPYIYGLVISPIGSKGTDLNIYLPEILTKLTNALISGFGYIPIFVSTICFIALAVSSVRRVFLALTYILFSLLLFYIYLSTDLVGTQKYQQEWFSPVYLLGIIFITGTFFAKLKFKLQIESIICVLALLLLSFLSFYKAPEIYSYNKKYSNKNQNFLAENYFVHLNHSLTPYPYSQAFEFTRRTFGAQNCLSVGVVYNLMPEIFSGINISEYRFLKNQRSIFIETQLINGSDWTSVVAQDLISANVSCVLLGSLRNKNEVIDTLLQNSWVIKRIFWHNSLPTSVVVMELKYDE